MKKFTLKSSLLAGLAALLFAFPSLKSGSLPDITKPYLGQYECKSATLGDKEYMDEFSYIKLELKPDETLLLYYCPKDGDERVEKGKYTYDKEKGELCLSLGENGAIKRKFPLKYGQILISFRVGGKLLTMKFEQK